MLVEIRGDKGTVHTIILCYEGCGYTGHGKRTSIPSWRPKTMYSLLTNIFLYVLYNIGLAWCD